MSMLETLAAKRQGRELPAPEIESVVKGYTQGAIPDYQMAAFLMAAAIRGMSFTETLAMTRAMARSGSLLDLGRLEGVKVDKHSTGGVGDKTTLVLAPLLAAAGVSVAKMSGRALGHTGGTIDKLQSIEGFRAELDTDEFLKQVERVGVAVTAQTRELVPADKKIYALREVTGTIESLPLIASSIMSKKIAAGADVIVLDIKVGSGAFVRTVPEAERLAELCVEIGERAGRLVGAVISDMNQPLGRAVGNALEIKEAVEALQGQGPLDLKELCLTLGASALLLAGKAESLGAATENLEQLIKRGLALAKFQEWVGAQGGQTAFVDDPSLLPQAPIVEDFLVPVDLGAPSQYLSKLDTRLVGLAAVHLGAGRLAKDGIINPAVGLLFHKKLGDRVKSGETLCTVFAMDRDSLVTAKRLLSGAVAYDVQSKALPLIKKLIGVPGGGSHSAMD